MTLLNTIRRIDSNISDLNNTKLTEILFYGEENLDKMNDRSTLDTTIKYLIETIRFDAKLYNLMQIYSFVFVADFFHIIFQFFLSQVISQHTYLYLVIVNCFV